MEAVEEIDDEDVEYEDEDGDGDGAVPENPDEGVDMVQTSTEPSLAVFIMESFLSEKGDDMLTADYSGEGEAVFIGGHVYKGDFNGGVMHGRGVYQWSDGVKYEGDFKFSTVTGEGTYTWPDGSVYKGGVDRGIRHGYGEFYCSTCPSVYSGDWKHGKRDGKGQINFDREGLSYYNGTWRDNKREGQGIRRFLSGNVYEGSWHNNRRHGKGTMWWHDRAERYVGDWVQGIQNGQGEHVWFQKRTTGSQYSVRNRYTGDWKDGLRHGFGVFEYASGARYEGQWNKNKKHGKGKFTFQTGVVYEGMFDNDTMVDNESPEMVTETSRPPTPLLSLIGDVRPSSRPGMWRDTDQKNANFVLKVENLIDDVNAAEQELQEVHYVVLRHISRLRDIYAFYSRLGRQESDDNITVLTRMQLWRVLCDCQLHHKTTTLAELDRQVGKALNISSNAELHHPEGQLLLRQFVQVLIHLSHFFYADAVRNSGKGAVIARCFLQLLDNDVLPKACRVNGKIFQDAKKTKHVMQYKQECWRVFETQCILRKETRSGMGTMRMRHFIFMLKDFGLIDDHLTASVAASAIARDNPIADDGIDRNFDVEIVFLEFIEALVDCAVHAIPLRHHTEKKGRSAVASHPVEADEEREECIAKEEEEEETLMVNMGAPELAVRKPSLEGTVSKDQLLSAKTSGTSVSEESGQHSTPKGKQEGVKNSMSQHSLGKSGSVLSVESGSSIASGAQPAVSNVSLAHQVIVEEDSTHSSISEAEDENEDGIEYPNSLSSNSLSPSHLDKRRSDASVVGVDWNDEFQVWCWQVDKFFTKRFFHAAQRY